MSENKTLKQFLFDKYGTEYPELCSDELHDTMQEYAKSYAPQVAREAAEGEPEFPGSMPDEMWEIIKNDRHACEKSHRIAVRETKQNILSRIEKLTEES